MCMSPSEPFGYFREIVYFSLVHKLSPEQRPVRDYNFYKLELQWPLIGTMRPELRLLNLHFFNICRHHPTLKFKPHATDDER